MAELKRILLFSSGLDSFILKKLYHFSNEECLFIDIGTEENRKEKEHILEYFPGVKIINFLNFSEFELQNKIIPFRNNIFALLAAQYSSSIYFAFTAGDTTRDKDYVFKAQMEGMLNYFVGIPEKSPVKNFPYSIEMPFKNKTKAELVASYLKEERNLFALEDLFARSVSCYEGGEKPCGHCRSCLRKYVALKVNGIEAKNRFMEDPNLFLEEFYIQSKKKNRLFELKNIEQCLKRR